LRTAFSLFGPKESAIGDPSACVWTAIHRAWNTGGGGASGAAVATVGGL